MQFECSEWQQVPCQHQTKIQPLLTAQCQWNPHRTVWLWRFKQDIVDERSKELRKLKNSLMQLGRIWAGQLLHRKAKAERTLEGEKSYKQPSITALYSFVTMKKWKLALRRRAPVTSKSLRHCDSVIIVPLCWWLFYFLQNGRVVDELLWTDAQIMWNPSSDKNVMH